MIILYMALIIFHELGHFLSALLFNWKIDKIYIYPMGGVTIFKDHINKPFFEELIVTIMGPIFQIILSIYLSRFNKDIILYSNTLLIFNMLPIVPLDGGRLSCILLYLFIPFKKSMYYIVKFSFIIWFIMLYFMIKTNSVILLLSFVMLIFKIIDEKNKQEYYYNKFILERYLNNYNWKNIIIYKLNDMYKYRNNYIYENNHLYSEKEYISKILCDRKMKYE